jgi:hypothetical protein
MICLITISAVQPLDFAFQEWLVRGGWKEKAFEQRLPSVTKFVKQMSALIRKTARADLSPVGTHTATIFVDQPINPFFTRPAYTTFLHICIRARPVTP